MKASRTLCAALAVLLLALSMSACKTTLTPGENGLYNDKNEINYINASTVYEAKELGKEYGVLQLTATESYKLYTIPDVPPEQMLATEDGDIVYASNLTMPTLKEMNPERLHICMDGTTTVHVIHTFEDPAVVSAIADAYANAPDIQNPGYAPLRNFRVRFESSEHAGFFYTLTYVEFAEDIVLDDINYGRYFLQSLFDQVFAPVDGSIHTVLGVDETDTETAAASE